SLFAQPKTGLFTCHARQNLRTYSHECSIDWYQFREIPIIAASDATASPFLFSLLCKPGR
ncbi:hypothetical protein, partial [Cronobacter sakazakii]|uniref:hypothetical protein n=1 Tax=Cronobacter sakazakii TaxID=28141 RepID=UPI001F453CFC